MISESEIKQKIIELLEYGNEDSFLIIEFGDEYYLQFMPSEQNDELYCEAVSNNYLPEMVQLSEDQIIKLIDMSWELPETDEDNFSQVIEIENEKSLDKIVTIIVETITKVYLNNVNIKLSYQINLE